MNTKQKEAIKKLVQGSIQHLGGQRAVATRTNVSPATISQIVNDNWDKISTDMWTRIGAALGYKEDAWQLVDTIYNMRMIEQTFADAKKHAMMMCVSWKAGSGKTAGSKLFVEKYAGRQVYYIQCREWSIKQFLVHLCQVLGVEVPRGNATGDDLMKVVVDFFLMRANHKPLLIVDEADKLKGTALRTFIPLYNETEDRLGIVLIGTEHLAQNIKRGVRYNKKGFDELDSRLGRNYIRLYGATQKDVVKICKANGITNANKQKAIWEECAPKQISVQGQFVRMVDDFRRLKRIVRRELIANG